jgi:hypothetical protein
MDHRYNFETALKRKLFFSFVKLEKEERGDD